MRHMCRADLPGSEMEVDMKNLSALNHGAREWGERPKSAAAPVEPEISEIEAVLLAAAVLAAAVLILT